MLHSAVEAESSAAHEGVCEGHDVGGHHKGVGAADHGQGRVCRHNGQRPTSSHNIRRSLSLCCYYKI